MEQKIIRSLNVYYYGMLFLAVGCATLLYFAIVKGYMMPVDRDSRWGMVIQYVAIFDVLLTVPGGLYFFKRRCERMSKIENQHERLEEYKKYAIRRIVMVGNGMTVGMSACYLLGGYQSMLWLAAIAAIAWFFAKPSEGKMERELLPRSKEEKY